MLFVFLLEFGGLCGRAVYLRIAEHLHNIRDPNTTWQDPGHTLDHLGFRDRDKPTVIQREIALINRTGVLAAGLNCNR